MFDLDKRPLVLSACYPKSLAESIIKEYTVIVDGSEDNKRGMGGEGVT